MANVEHLEILKSGLNQWHEWRVKNINIQPDLSGADLSHTNLIAADFHTVNLNNAGLLSANLRYANLSHANLNKACLYYAILDSANLSHANLNGANFEKTDMRIANLSHANLNNGNLFNAYLSGAKMEKTELTGANLSHANLTMANLAGANLSRANLAGANLTGANLTGAILTEVNLSGAILTEANLSQCYLSQANLTKASLIDTILNNADIDSARIYGISVWGIKKEGLIQKDLIITKLAEPEITVDNLEVAQFIYLMLNNKNIRDVIDTLTSKTVLILGRFTNERKPLLDAIKDELRKRNYLPILFDFEKPTNRDLTETISILAKMSRFVIADLTDAQSIPQELSLIVPHTPSLPIVPIIINGQREYAMFEHFKSYPWVMPLHAYETPETMLAEIVEMVIEPAELKMQEIRRT